MNTKELLRQFETKDLEATKIRAKAKFTEQGERSTRYFFNLEKRQQECHTIKTLTRDNLDTITDTRDLIAETYNFYHKLFSAEEMTPTAQQEIFNAYPIPSLPEQNQLHCDAKLTEHELHQALLTMENNKSPGIDGLTTNFYKHFWNLLGPELTNVYNYAFNQGILSTTQRRGIVTLIFKKGDRTRLKNWRPITLLTTDYKILTKTLAIRLRDVLHLLIHTDQTACIPGRTINDNVSLIRDVIHYANETDTPLAMVSIDQLKAFDRVSHDFLHKTLQQFGFGPLFRHWISTIYNHSTSSIKVNGWLTKFINMERGLRQGCALSMPLYILTAEILAIHIRNNANIHGITLNKPEVKLSQYADDTTLFLRDDQSVFESFKTLTLYEHASGAKINLEKCQGLWSGSLKLRSENLLNFQWYNDYLPDKILGLYFGNTDCTKINIEKRIKKIKDTISTWKSRDLSFKGKTLIINGLLTSTLWYTATSTPIPSWAVSDIEQAIYNFFWDNKAPLTTRDILALPTAKGGFNIHRIQPKIEALRLNSIRRLLDPTPAHWKNFTEHFLRTSNMPLGKLTLTTQFSTIHIDKSIPIFHQELLRAWLKFKQHTERINSPSVYIDILNEPLFKSTLIQYEGILPYNKTWITAGITRIKDICYEAIPGLLPIEAIHEIISRQDCSPTRTLHKTAQEFHNIIQAIPQDWLRLIYNPASHPPSTPQPFFKIINTPSDTVDFTRGKTRLFYQLLMNDRYPTIAALQVWHDHLQSTPPFNHRFWKLMYPPMVHNRIGDLNWKIAHRILPTALSLSRMTVYHTSNCRHCALTETIEHLLFNCRETQAFWHQIKPFIENITDKQVTLTSSLVFFGYLRRKNDPLTPSVTNLLNWLISMCRYAIHKSAVDFRLRNETIHPYTIFKLKVQSHLTQQYKLCKLQHTTYYFPLVWGIRDALVKIVDEKLIFNL